MASNSSSRIFSGVPDITVYLAETADPQPFPHLDRQQESHHPSLSASSVPPQGWREARSGVHPTPGSPFPPSREASEQG